MPKNENKDILKNFLTGSDDTGRFVVRSLVTGRTYYVEPIDSGERADWGDLNPATKKLEGDYGRKHKGAVKESESLITPENGFTNIKTLPAGYSPLEYIEELDKKYRNESKIKEDNDV